MQLPVHDACHVHAVPDLAVSMRWSIGHDHSDVI